MISYCKVTHYFRWDAEGSYQQVNNRSLICSIITRTTHLLWVLAGLSLLCTVPQLEIEPSTVLPPI